MINRVMRVFRLDPTVFREIAEDQTALSQAAIIVVIVTLLSAIGAAVGALIADTGGAVGTFLFTWLSGILLGWLLWSVLTYFVGTALFHGQTDIPEMLRVLGFASAPQLLGIFGIIPCLGWIASLVGWVLSLIAGVIAVREAMEFTSGKAVATVLISWIISFVLNLAIGAIIGIGAAGASTLLGG